MSKSSSSLSVVGLIGVVLWGIPSCLSSQGISPPQQITLNGTQPFAEFDDSLARAADSFLIPAVQSPRSAIINTTEDKTSVVDFTFSDQSSRSPGDRAQRTTAERFDLLRPVVEPILRNRGVPTELAAVILVESSGRVNALSPKGARGLWQLMPDTARRYGLQVDEIRDDRMDVFKGTDAAARYLHDLYAQFGNWKLALAAYNTGEANLGSAMLRAHTRDFDQLTNLRVLPLETRNYVPRVLTAARFLGHSSELDAIRIVATAKHVFAVSTP